MDKFQALIEKQAELIKALEEEQDKRDGAYQEELMNLHSKEHVVEALTDKIASKQNLISDLELLEGKDTFFYSSKVWFKNLKDGIKQMLNRESFMSIIFFLLVLTYIVFLSNALGPIVVGGLLLGATYISPVLLATFKTKKKLKSYNLEALKEEVKELSEELAKTKIKKEEIEKKVKELLARVTEVYNEKSRAMQIREFVKNKRTQAINGIITEEALNESFDKMNMAEKSRILTKKEGEYNGEII